VVCPLRGQSLESRLAAQRGVRRAEATNDLSANGTQAIGRDWREVRQWAVVVTCLLVFLGALLWESAKGPSLLRPGSESVFEPSQAGELVVQEVLGASGASRGRAQGQYDQLVRLPSGRVLAATFRELLPKGEHLKAVYSVSSDQKAIRVEAYVRCGESPCPPSARP